MPGYRVPHTILCGVVALPEVPNDGEDVDVDRVNAEPDTQRFRQEKA